MTHYIRNMETHLKNTWQWDAWGFTSEWGACSMTDVDGWFAYEAERRDYFLTVEVKHWDGTGEKPHIDKQSGQMRFLRRKAVCHPEDTIVIAFGDTSTKKIHYYEVWIGNETIYPEMPFKDYLTAWFKNASKK